MSQKSKKYGEIEEYTGVYKNAYEIPTKTITYLNFGTVG